MKGLSGGRRGGRLGLGLGYVLAIYRELSTGGYLQGGLSTGGTIYRGYYLQGGYLWDFTVFIFNTNRTPEEMGQRLLMSFSSQMRTNARQRKSRVQTHTIFARTRSAPTPVNVKMAFLEIVSHVQM